MSVEEERMLKMAIKNSLAQSKNLIVPSPVEASNEGSTNISNSSALEEIEEVKTFRPTEEEFKDPMRYIE
jgi:jmjN domain